MVAASIQWLLGSSLLSVRVCEITQSTALDLALATALVGTGAFCTAFPFGALDAIESQMDSGFLITSTAKNKYKTLILFSMV